MHSTLYYFYNLWAICPLIIMVTSAHGWIRCIKFFQIAPVRYQYNSMVASVKSFSIGSDVTNISLCPRCRGEGAILKAPSKKARLRHKRQRNNSTDQHLPLPLLPKRREACVKCDQSGILISRQNDDIDKTSFVTNTTTAIGSALEGTCKDSPVRVAIVGAGIAGFALAVALQHRGINFHIFEKDSCFNQRRQGYGLTLQQSRRHLRALGIIENEESESETGTKNYECSRGGKLLQDHAVTSTKHVVHTPDGTICGEWGMRKWLGTDNVDTMQTSKRKKRRQNLHVPRQILRYSLYESLYEATCCENKKKLNAANADCNGCISWGHKFMNMKPTRNIIATDCQPNASISAESSSKVELTFQVVDKEGNETNLVTSEFDVVVGTDGINSSVRQKLFHRLPSVYNKKVNAPLRFLNCIVILGICQLSDLLDGSKHSNTSRMNQNEFVQATQISPLLDGKTVFQTADGKTRIYMMPYSKKNNEYMWQLSFPMAKEEAIHLSQRGPEALKDEAVKRCQSWHVPIPEILRQTRTDLVSGYPVYDRYTLTADIFKVSRKSVIQGPDIDENETCLALPVTLCGDSAHPMTPFKGQGANQAMLDALALARSIHRVHFCEDRSIIDALEVYEREMIDRSSVKVHASREAARFLHTEVAIQASDVTRGAAFSLSSISNEGQKEMST